MDVKKISVLGCGGIGGNLVEPLVRWGSFTKEGDEPPKFLLVDGDNFEAKNLERQACGFSDLNENKAVSLQKRMESLFPAIDIDTFTEYITPENVAEVIGEGDVVFAGFDNHKSRKIIADRCEVLDNVTLISGGNELEDGGCQIFIKRDGKKLTANLWEYHPEIAEPKDKAPNELGCGELMQSARQIIFMNLAVASAMLNGFYGILTTENLEDDLYGEVYVDIKQAKMVPEMRPVTD